MARRLGLRTTDFRHLALLLSLGIIATMALLAGAALAAPREPGFDYRYFDREDLSRDLDEWVGKGVVVTDVLLHQWEHQEVDRHIKFDTTRFRCVLPRSESESLELLSSLSAQTDDGGPGKRLITIWGVVERPEFWGKVVNGSQGVTSEKVVIRVHELTRPRKRFFRDLDLTDDN